MIIYSRVIHHFRFSLENLLNDLWNCYCFEDVRQSTVCKNLKSRNNVKTLQHFIVIATLILVYSSK